MNKSYRIRTEVGTNADKYIKLKLDQEYDSFEILSLGIDQKDIYQSFNCNYGVIIGRVTANGGVGIPNAKLSIFIPITDDDSLRPEIKAIYPYESPREKNREGKRYNLLPRVGQTQLDGTVRPKQPFGSFPTKEEFVTNDAWLEVYDTYYKFSTVTNDSGDFMLFGVPVGTQSVHLSVDILDIGRFSMTPATLVTNLGYSPNLFRNNGTRIKESTDLDDLPNIETQEISVEVIPFCGDSENFDIGITRQDFRIRAELVNNFVLFGTHQTMAENASWGDANATDPGAGRDSAFYKGSYDNIPDAGGTVSDIRINRIGKIDPKIYYIPNTISDNDIDTGNFNPQTDWIRLGDSEFFIINDDGQFIMSIPCNRKKIITDEFGNDLIVANDSSNGVFTEFYGTMILDYEDIPITIFQGDEWIRDTPSKFARTRFKIPQSERLDRDDNASSNAWRKEGYKFVGSKLYSVSQFLVTFWQDDVSNGPDDDDIVNSDRYNYLDNSVNSSQVPGNIKTGGRDLISGVGTFTQDDFPTNAIVNGGFNDEVFGAQWINFHLYFPQFTWAEAKDDGDGGFNNRKLRAVELFYNDTSNEPRPWRSNFYLFENTENIIGGEIGTNYFAKTNYYRTDFIEVPKEDIIIFNERSENGFSGNDIGFSLLKGSYKYDIPNNAPNTSGDLGAWDSEYNLISPNPYFTRGTQGSNVISLLFDSNFI